MSSEVTPGYTGPAQPLAALLRELDHLGRHIELAHCADVDIAINNDSDLSGRAHEVAELFRDGVPRDWPALNDANSHVFTGSLASLRLVAKQRFWVDGSDGLARVRDCKEKGFSIPHHAIALNSVINELSLSPKIKRLMASREAQEAARQYGFSGIAYVEPVIAYIDRRWGHKGAVYEWVDASDAHEYPGADTDESVFTAEQWSGVTEAVKNLIRGNGVRPIDLRPKDLLINAGNGLHLIDTEAFYAG